MKHFFKNLLFQNILALYSVHAVNVLLPLITVPYLARVLGAEGWGLIAFTQAFANYMIIVVEYGFALSATREVVRLKEDPVELSRLVCGVMGAKILLACAALTAAILLKNLVPAFGEYPSLFWAGVVWAIAQGLSVLWYFQGQERMKLVARLDVSFKAMVTVALFVIVRGPADAWKVLGLQAAGSILSTIVGLGLIAREVSLSLPRISEVWRALWLGWTMFVFRGSVSLYTAGNAFILGLFVSPQLVGYYAGAEKISKAVLGLMNPVSDAMYPRMTNLVRTAMEDAVRVVRKALGAIGGVGFISGIGIYVCAPLIVKVLLGPAFEPSVGVLRILALLPPLIAVSNVLGIQWMLPLGLDKFFNVIIILAGLVNIGLAVFLAPRFAHYGMAWAVVASELVVTVGMIGVLWRQKLTPFSPSFFLEGFRDRI